MTLICCLILWSENTVGGSALAWPLEMGPGSLMLACVESLVSNGGSGGKQALALIDGELLE